MLRFSFVFFTQCWPIPIFKSFHQNFLTKFNKTMLLIFSNVKDNERKINMKNKNLALSRRYFGGFRWLNPKKVRKGCLIRSYSVSFWILIYIWQRCHFDKSILMDKVLVTQPKKKKKRGNIFTMFTLFEISLILLATRKLMTKLNGLCKRFFEILFLK